MPVDRWCHRCNGTYDPDLHRKGCPHCRAASGATGRSTTRNPASQARFRRLVLARDGHRCTWVDQTTGERCTATHDLRACHYPRPLADFSLGDPAASATSAGVTMCATHDRATDAYAR